MEFVCFFKLYLTLIKLYLIIFNTLKNKIRISEYSVFKTFCTGNFNKISEKKLKFLKPYVTQYRFYAIKHY